MKTFEQRLQEIHADQYKGLDDEMGEDFLLWLDDEFGTEELLAWHELWFRNYILDLKEKLMDMQKDFKYPDNVSNDLKLEQRISDLGYNKALIDVISLLNEK